MSFLNEEQLKKITDQLLSYATADETRIWITPARSGNTRFARNEVSTSGYVETLQIAVTSQYGKRTGNATGNQFDDASLKAVIQRAEETARLAPEDPEVMPLLGPQTYDPYTTYSADGDLPGADYRAKIVTGALAAAAAKGLETAGIVQTYSDCDAMANSKGLHGFRRTTGVYYSLTARSKAGGSGWAGGTANAIAGFDSDAMTSRAIDIAARTEGAVALEPGNYTTILSPECVGDLATTLLFGFDQRSLDEGRSFLSKFQKELAAGEKILSEKVRIYCDPAFKDCPGYSFDIEGQPVRATDWVREGVIKTIGCSRYWAKKNNREPVPFPTNILMAGGTSSLDEMIASTKRGIYVNRFWYVRSVDPQTALYTGLTRDGCFLIENGKITRPVKNFRWNETPVKMLRNIEMMGPSRRTITSEQDLNSGLYFPTLKVNDFTFSSLSDAL